MTIFRVNGPSLLRFAAIFSLAMMLLVPVQSRADDYVKPTMIDLAHMLIRFGAVNLDDSEIIDDYALMAECNLYIDYYRNDFKWHEIQRLMRKKLEDDIPTYPTSFYVDLPMQLDRYDFNEKVYKFLDKAAPKNANAFVIGDGGVFCDYHPTVVWPKEYRFVLNRSVTLLGLPLFEDDAKMLLTRMNDAGNKDHVIYARYKIRAFNVTPYTRHRNALGQITGPLIQDRKDPQIESQLGMIEFYEDPARTKLIYVYRP